MAEVMLRPRLEALLGHRGSWLADLDHSLLAALALILSLGLVMLASASVSVAEEAGAGPLHFLTRQLIFLPVALTGALIALRIPLERVQALATPLMLFAVFLLTLVLVPGVGHEANGATRWLPIGLFNVQVSEVARVLLLVYVAAQIQRHIVELQQSPRPLIGLALVLVVVGLLLLAQPDFGSLAILIATVGTMVFIAGTPLLVLILLASAGGVGAAALIVSSPYRLERLIAFRDPWADPFDTGFQLTQSLIAVGRGEWLGVGLGNSVQKLYYLPEAHTDFLFAVLAEELGFVGMAAVIALFAFVVWRACLIGARALRGDDVFAGLLAYGVGVWLALQTFVNMGVNLGLLPTKGLTLPLMSYGGSSLVMNALALGLLLRVDFEQRRAARSASRMPRRGVPT
jgi:cell division protein FtsW